MENNNVNMSEPMNGGVEEIKSQELPTKISVWTKIKNFLFQEVTVELTPKQEKVFKEVHDFWCQDITWQGIKDFWLQDIEITL
jgi:hypothetical protein